MGQTSRVHSAGAPAVAEVSPEERRQTKRLEVCLPARIRPFDPGQRHLEEVRRTLNFTRHGVYFTTRLEHYSPGMRVLLTLPYSSGATVQREYLGQVLRLEVLSDGSRGVAIQFLP